MRVLDVRRFAVIMATGLSINFAMAADTALELETCLTDRFQDRERIASDYAVLLATKYRKALTGPAGPGRDARLAVILAACRSAARLSTPDDGRPQTASKARPQADVIKLPLGQWPRLVDSADRAGLMEALDWAERSLAKTSKARLPLGRRSVTVDALAQSVARFRVLAEEHADSRALESALREEFDLYQSPGIYETREVLFTAYNNPVYSGSLRRKGPYQVPLYRNPRKKRLDPKRWARAEITQGVLAGRGLEICWLKDPLDAYLLEVEGSGVIALDDGRFLKLKHAGGNGHPYSSLGKTMVRQGILKPWEMDMPRIRRWLAEHSDKRQGFLDLNESTVFFEEEVHDQLPVDHEYVPGRSVACDQKYFPRGGIAFARLARPLVNQAGSVTGAAPFDRFVVDHDVGGAIKGPGHIDLYWGHDQESEVVSGTLREPGQLYHLLLRGTRLHGR